MKKLVFLLFAFVLMFGSLAVLIQPQPARADGVVTFPDPNLEAAIREEIGKPTGDIMQSDLSGITILTVYSADIINLSGLEYCTNLIGLSLGDNQISDISPISGLISLEHLELDNNQISDISLLSGFTSLTWLTIGDNQISDISPLSGLTNLDFLYLYNNQISDISSLSGLTNLETLSLWNNQISDISTLSSLINLTWIQLDVNLINDISPLSGLTGLTFLGLGENQISDILPLSGLPNLTELYLDSNQISDIAPLVDNTGLDGGDTVNLWNNPLSDTSLNVYIPQLLARGVDLDWSISFATPTPSGSGTPTPTGAATPTPPSSPTATPEPTPTPTPTPAPEWTAQDSGTTAILMDIWGSSPSDIYATGDIIEGQSYNFGVIVHYDGSKWEVTYNSSSELFMTFGIWGTSPSNVLVVGGEGNKEENSIDYSAIIRYDGSSWNRITTPLFMLTAIWGPTSTELSDIFCAGINVNEAQDTTLQHFDGSNWTEMTNPTSYHITDMWGTSSNDIFAVAGFWFDESADNGVILHYDGTNWTEMINGSVPALPSIWGISSNDIFAVGMNGTILHYDGIAWNEMNSSTNENFYGVWGSSHTNVFAVGDNGTILHYDGTSWTPMTSGTDESLSRVWGFTTGDVWAVGDNGTILHYTGQAETTPTSTPSAGMYPPPGSDIEDDTPLFQWEPVEWATGYRIQVSTDPDFDEDSIVLDEILGDTQSYEPSFKLDSGDYYWRTQAFSAEIDGNWSDAISFAIEEQPYESDFIDSVILPDEISTDPEVIGTNALFASILVLVFYFAATLFNSTIKENYKTISRWFGRSPKRPSNVNNRTTIKNAKPATRRRGSAFLISAGAVLLFALLYGFLDPSFTSGIVGLVVFISMAVAIGLETFFFEGLQVLLSRRRFRIPAAFKVHPIAIAIAVVFVLISRLADFQPGLIYGFIGGYIPLAATRRLNKSQQGVTVLISTLLLVIIVAAAFFLRVPVHNAAADGNTFWLTLAEGILVAIFAIGVEGMLFALMPITFMEGSKLARWNRAVWLIMFAIVAFLFYHIIVNTDGTLADAIGDASIITIFGLTGFFLVLSIVVWIYFRLRKPRKAPKRRLQTNYR